MDQPDFEQMRRKLAELKTEHRDLDDVIRHIVETSPFDQLQNLIFQRQFALLQALQLQLVEGRTFRELGDNVIEVSMLRPELRQLATHLFEIGLIHGDLKGSAWGDYNALERFGGVPGAVGRNGCHPAAKSCPQGRIGFRLGGRKLL